MTKHFWALLLFLPLSMLLLAQNNQELLFRVLDAETKEPISYATVQFVNRGGGTVANIDGGFRVPQSFYQDKERLMISSMGYRSQAVVVEKASLTSVNDVFLQIRVEELDQVVIQGKRRPRRLDISPEEVVMKAIAAIPDNYPQTSYSTIGYYRDYQLVGDQYYNLNEAIIESFDGGFQTDVIMDEQSQSALYSYKENKEFRRDSILASVYDGESKYIKNTMISGQGGNELSILNIHNPIRNFDYQSFSFVYHFKTRFLPNHDLLSMRSIYFNEELIYEISFKANESLSGTSHRAKGRIYIDQDSFAIYKFFYQVKQNNDNHTVFEVDIQYQKIKDLMYLNYITFNNQFNMAEQFQFDVKDVFFDAGENAMYVGFNNAIDANSVQKKNFRFKYDRKKLMVDQVEVVDPKTVKIIFAEWSLPQSLTEEMESKESAPEQAKELMEKFSYRIKNVYDVGQRKLYQSPTISGFQYREFFVQKVKPTQELPRDLSFINKRRPLTESPVNESQRVKDYWLNTPLRN